MSEELLVEENNFRRKEQQLNLHAALNCKPSCSKSSTTDSDHIMEGDSCVGFIIPNKPSLLESLRASINKSGDRAEVLTEETTTQQQPPPTTNCSFLRAPGLGPSSSPDLPSSSLPHFRCDICGFSCQSKFHYNSHMNTHSDHQCTMCDYTSRTEGRLKKHMRDSHTIEEQLAAGLDVDPSALSFGTSTASSSYDSGIATAITSVLEAANLAAAQYAATNGLNGDQSKEKSVNFEGGNEMSVGDNTNATTVISSSHSDIPTSALDQIQALTDNTGLINNLSSRDLALFTQGILQSTSSLPSSPEGSRFSSAVGERRSSNKPKTYTCKQCSHISTSKEEQWTHSRSHIPREKQLNCQMCGFVTEYKHHLVGIYVYSEGDYSEECG